jgi:hypothetical protein
VFAAHDATEVERLTNVETDERAALVGNRLPFSPARELYLKARSAEDETRLPCQRRQFFTSVRFDEPLQLQGPRPTNTVFYMGRDAGTGRRPAPLGDCDYVITTAALMQTDRGRATAEVLAGSRPLQEVARVGDFILLALRDRQGRN